MSERKADDDIAQFFEWQQIIQRDGFLEDFQEKKSKDDNPLELAKKLRFSFKKDEQDTEGSEDKKPEIYKEVFALLMIID